MSVSDSRPGGCEFDPWLRQTFFPAEKPRFLIMFVLSKKLGFTNDLL